MSGKKAKYKKQWERIDAAVNEWQQTKSKEAAERVIIEMDPLIRGYVKKRRRITISGFVDAEDLTQEANLGILRALEKYDGSIPFALYASFWINSCIQKYIEKAAVVNYGRGQYHRKLITTYIKRRFELEGEFPEATTHEIHQKIADEIGCDIFYVDAIRLEKMGMFSLNQKPSGKLRAIGPTLENVVTLEPNFEDDVNKLLDSKRIIEYILTFAGEFSELERDVLENRILSDVKVPLKDIAKRQKRTRQRIEQIEKKLVTIIKRKVKLHLKGD